MTANSASAIQPDTWAEHFAAWRLSKLSRAAYCRQHGLKVHVFLYRLNRQHSAPTSTLTLVPVSTGMARSSPNELTLRGPQGWSLSLSTDVSAAWLGQLLGALS
ncbi:MAG: IS66 family insertion sequence element accessory protein TnpB [Pseudomonadota bacterium]